MSLATIEHVHDLIRGLTLLGTGGGGRPEAGLEALLPHVRAGREVRWTSAAALPPEAWVCSAFGMGSIAPGEALTQARRVAAGYPPTRVVARPMSRAVRELETYTGRRVAAIVPFELGAGNTAAALDAAVDLGVPVVDGDLCGRALPELAQATAALAGIAFTPAAIADPWGTVLLLKETPSALVAERIGKLVSIATKLPDMTATCAHAGFLMPARRLPEVLVVGGVSRALAVGRAIREASAAAGDPVAAAARAVGGWALFRGKVIKKVWESRDGYMFGMTALRGERADSGVRVEVWFQNENHVTWRDGQPWIHSPDLIMLMDAATGAPYTNADLPEGASVAMLGAPADARLRTPEALARLGPRHYGYDLDYVPIETQVGASPP
jgi:uncharacterized protein